MKVSTMSLITNKKIILNNLNQIYRSYCRFKITKQGQIKLKSVSQLEVSIIRSQFQRRYKIFAMMDQKTANESQIKFLSCYLIMKDDWALQFSYINITAFQKIVNIYHICYQQQSINIDLNMHNRNYCCYRHFKEGKHELSCTHCYSHVPLGNINPPHSPSPLKLQRPIPPLQIRSQPFRIQNRNHDENQIKHKDSLPMRLKQPRVYIEKVVNKFQKTQPLLPIKHTGALQYQKLVKYFRKIGQNLPQKSKACLVSEIKSFALQNKMSKNLETMFFNQRQFVQFLLQKFRNFRGEEAEQFWQISYNSLRFRQKISAEAFVYNFGKFYLQLININNTFSQAALRQRMIDLRVLLINWFSNQICFKYNMKDLGQQIHQIQKQFQLSSNEQLYCDFRYIVEECKLAHIKLRFLAQLLFNLTDQKYLNFEKVEQAMQQKIEQRARKISTSRKVLHEFFEINEYTSEQNFAVTDILQFCKVQNYDEQVIADIINWIQGLFDYLFFVKPEDKELGLTLNFETRRLQCSSILQVNADMIRQYDLHLQKNYDEQIEICKNLTVILKQTLGRISDLKGPKKIIVQCNNVAQIILRFIRSIDLSAFWKIVQCTLSYRNRGDTSQISNILKTKPNQEQIKKNMKGLFILPQISSDQNQPQQTSIKRQSEGDRVNIALKNYNSIKQEPLSIKVKAKAKTKQEQNQENSQFDENVSQSMKNNIVEPKEFNLPTMGRQCSCSFKLMSLADRLSMQCNCIRGYSTKYWLQTSKQTSATISAVESLQSRLFQLLDFD